MAHVIKRMESDSKDNIPASEMVNIDLESDIFPGRCFKSASLISKRRKYSIVLQDIVRDSSRLPHRTSLHRQLGSKRRIRRRSEPFLHKMGPLMQRGSLEDSEKSVFPTKPFSCLGEAIGCAAFSFFL